MKESQRDLNVESSGLVKWVCKAFSMHREAQNDRNSQSGRRKLDCERRLHPHLDKAPEI